MEKRQHSTQQLQRQVKGHFTYLGILTCCGLCENVFPNWDMQFEPKGVCTHPPSTHITLLGLL